MPRQILFVSAVVPGYHRLMAKANKFDFEAPVPVSDHEDPETLAAIEQGIQDAEAGRTIPSEDVRRRIPEWISASSTPKER